MSLPSSSVLTISVAILSMNCGGVGRFESSRLYRIPPIGAPVHQNRPSSVRRTVTKRSQNGRKSLKHRTTFHALRFLHRQTTVTDVVRMVVVALVPAIIRERSINRRHVYTKQTALERDLSIAGMYTQSRQHQHVPLPSPHRHREIRHLGRDPSIFNTKSIIF